jgi:hypothetical protein
MDRMDGRYERKAVSRMMCVQWIGPVRLALASSVLALLPELCVLKWLSIS